MNLDKYVEQKVAAALAEFEAKTHIELPYSATLQVQCRVLVLEAMRDQRHGRAEAVIAVARAGSAYDNFVSRDEAHQAVMNAEPKEEPS